MDKSPDLDHFYLCFLFSMFIFSLMKKLSNHGVCAAATGGEGEGSVVRVSAPTRRLRILGVADEEVRSRAERRWRR